jgi:hypothetical protein
MKSEVSAMEERTLRWGVCLDDTNGAFLLGANININKEHAYICIYLGFRTLVIGKDYF